MGEIVSIMDARDFGKKPYQQKAHVFLQGMTNTSVKLKTGERLFVLTDNGIEEGPHTGPDDVLIVTEHFGCWPVVAFAIPAHHVEAWRRIDPEKSAPKMMARVRGMLERRNAATPQEARMSGEVERIARGLTKAQRRAMAELPDEFRMWPVSISRVTIKRLVEGGVLEAVRSTTGFGLTLHRWTQSGLAVRAYLQEQQQ